MEQSVPCVLTGHPRGTVSRQNAKDLKTSLDNTLVQYMNEFSSTLTPGGGLAARESYDACTNTVAATNTSLKPTLTLGWGVAAGLGRRPGCVVQVTYLLSLQYPSGDEL